MDPETGDGRTPVAPTRRTAPAKARRAETRTLWLPDEWAVYIANGDDPESPDWPVALCDEELRRLHLEGFDTVTCTDDTRELREYRGVVGTLRAYEALRIGGDDIVTRTVTLVRERTELPAGDVTRELEIDVKLTLTRSESQPAERLAARAVLEATGLERRVARARGTTAGAPVDPVWLHIDIEGDAEPLPRDAWTDQDVIAARLDGRNRIDRIVLKAPRVPVGRQTAVPPWCRRAPFYDHDGQVRCFGCDGIKYTPVHDGRRPGRMTPTAYLPKLRPKAVARLDTAIEVVVEPVHPLRPSRRRS